MLKKKTIVNILYMYNTAVLLKDMPIKPAIYGSRFTQEAHSNLFLL